MTKQEERVFRLGDMVFDAGRLVEVSKEQAFIVINNKKGRAADPHDPPCICSGRSAGTRTSACRLQR